MADETTRCGRPGRRPGQGNTGTAGQLPTAVVAVALLMTLVATVAPPAARAQASPEVVARLQSLLQEATRARARLERDNARLNSEVEDLTKQLERLEASGKKLNAQLGASRTQAASLQQESQRCEARYTRMRGNWDKLLGSCTESVYLMRDIERERGDFVTRLAARNKSLSECAAANERLLEINEEILGRYETDGRGRFKAAADREPFVQLSRVELENAVDDYRFEAQTHEFFAPEELPLIPADADTQSIDGRWQCSLAGDGARP
jgi:chromosome segregation ATPase